MTHTKHTPAPWSVEGRITGKGFDRSAIVAKTLIAEVYSEAFKDIENEKANAHLIAAAPDMYEALKALSDYYELPVSQSCLDAINNALAKAEGKQCQT